jgi:uncharacterized protein YgiB involved in biofilm formation
MKRSHAIVLGAAGLMMVAGVLSDRKPADEPVKAQAYANAEECKADVKNIPAECDAQWAKAKEQQLASAPKFQEKADCEKAHGAGQCQQSTWNGASVFAPAMIGYMMGRMMGGQGSAVTQPLYPAGAAAGCAGANAQLRPDCAAKSSGSASSYRTYTTGGGAVVVRDAAGGNAVTTRNGATSMPSNSAVVSRGGFGSTAHGMSSGG